MFGNSRYSNIVFFEVLMEYGRGPCVVTSELSVMSWSVGFNPRMRNWTWLNLGGWVIFWALFAERLPRYTLLSHSGYDCDAGRRGHSMAWKNWTERLASRLDHVGAVRLRCSRPRDTSLQVVVRGSRYGSTPQLCSCIVFFSLSSYSEPFTISCFLSFS